MNPVQNNQLLHLDRALLALLDERARLWREAGASVGVTALDDLLRRHAGPIDAASVREFFAAIDQACARAAAREARS